MFFPFPNRRFLLNGCVLLIGAWAVFIWPWTIPPTRRVISDSYNMGFNNMLAILAVGFSLLALIALRLAPRRLTQKPLESDFADDEIEARCHHYLQDENIARWNRRDLVWALAASLAGVVFIFALWSQLPNRYFGEMKSFIPCSELILLGRAPYTQFQFNYGPLFLYLPLWIVSAARSIFGVQIGVDIGYIFALAIFTVIGLLLLSYATTILDARRRNWIFLLLSTPFIFNLGLGMNYTALRFAAPYAALLWLHRCAQPKNNLTQNLTENFSKNGVENGAEALGVWWKIALALASGAVFCFLISPEIGISFLLAALVYMGFLFRKQTAPARRSLTVCLALGLAASFLILGFLSPAYFLSIWSFGGGGYNLPIVPGIYIVFYLATLACVVPRLATQGLKRHGARASLVLGWSTLIVILVAPALGRCDFGHILCNGIGAFLGAFLLTGQTRGRAFGFYAVTYAFLFTVCAPIFGYGPYISESIRSYRAGQRAVNRVFWQPASGAQRAKEEKFAAALEPYSKIGTPLGCSEALEIYLKRTNRFVPEFYTAPAYGSFTQSQVDEKTAEIRRMDIILVRQSTLEQAKRTDLKELYGRNQARFLQKLLMFPLEYRWRNEPLFADMDWANAIQRDFQTIGTFQKYVLMKRKVRAMPSGN